MPSRWASRICSSRRIRSVPRRWRSRPRLPRMHRWASPPPGRPCGPALPTASPRRPNTSSPSRAGCAKPQISRRASGPWPSAGCPISPVSRAFVSSCPRWSRYAGLGRYRAMCKVPWNGPAVLLPHRPVMLGRASVKRSTAMSNKSIPTLPRWALILARIRSTSACRDNRSVLYQRIPKLFADLALARGDGRYARILRALGGVQLLILDDWGLEPLDAAARHDLLEILEERYGRRSTIITSQILVDKWHDLIGDPTYADAILDRIVHNAHRINLSGHSLRRSRASKASKE